MPKSLAPRWRGIEGEGDKLRQRVIRIYRVTRLFLLLYLRAEND